MSALKKIRWIYLFVSLVPVALGIVCIVKPGFIAGIICYVAGVLLLIFGLGKIVRYFASRSAFVDSLIVGVLFSLLGFILVTRPDQVLEMIFIFIGILILLDGVIKMKHSFEAKVSGGRDWIALLIAAVLVMGFGILIIANPFSGLVPIIILGVAVLIDGLQNVYAALRLAFVGRSKETGIVKKTVPVEDFDVHGED